MLKSKEELATAVAEYIKGHGKSAEALAAGVSLQQMLSCDAILLSNVADVVKEYFEKEIGRALAGPLHSLQLALKRVSALEERLVQAEVRGFTADRRGMDSIEERLKAVERGGVTYRGTFQKAEFYRRGDLVTEDGAVWCAVRDTREEPGTDTGCRDWALAVKSLRNAQGQAITAISPTIALRGELAP